MRRSIVRADDGEIFHSPLECYQPQTPPHNSPLSRPRTQHAPSPFGPSTPVDPIGSESPLPNSHLLHSQNPNLTSSFVQPTPTLSPAHFFGCNQDVSTPIRSKSLHFPSPTCPASVENQSEVPPSALPRRSNDSTIWTRLAVRNNISSFGASHEEDRGPVKKAVLAQTRLRQVPSIFSDTSNSDDVPSWQECPEVKLLAQNTDACLDTDSNISSEDLFDLELDNNCTNETGCMGFSEDRTIPGMRGISFTQNAIEDIASSLFDDAIEEDVEDDFAEVSVSVDDVDKEIEPRFISEVREVIKKIEAEVLSNAVKRQFTFSVSVSGETCRTTLSRLDVVRAFLPLGVLEKVRSSANRTLSMRRHDLVEVEELLGIIIFHVLFASYGASATTLCSAKGKNCFLQIGISSSRYKEVWSVHNALNGKRTRTEGHNSTWTTRPIMANSLIAELEQDLAAINRNLLYVPNSTIISLDDDHLRLSCRAVSLLTNLRQVSNPAKALGPVCNAMCTALTLGFIAGHLSRPNEKLLDVWLRLVQLFHDEPTKSALVLMADTVFAADRGYNCKDTIDFIINTLGASALGTHKQSLDYHFVFGEGPIPKRPKGLTVSEKRCRAVYSAKQKVRGGVARRQVEATVYRECYSGRIAAVYSNNERMFGSTKYTLVPRDNFRRHIDPCKIRALATLYDDTITPLPAVGSSHTSDINGSPEVNLNYIYNSVKHLTFLQSEDPTWFLLRAFTFTSRTASQFFRETAKGFTDNVESLASFMNGRDVEEYGRLPDERTSASDIVKREWDMVLSCVGMMKDNRTVFVPCPSLKDGILALTESSLNQKRKDDISKILSDAGRGQPASTRKSRLVQIALQLRDSVREEDVIIEHGQPLSATALLDLKEEKYMKSLRRASIDSCVMKPLVATSGMKEGSLIETSVLRAIPSFVSNHNGCYLRDKWTVFSDPSRYILQYERSFKVLGVESVGLLCQKGNAMFGDSPNAICVYADIDGVRRPAAIEVKTMTSYMTIEHDKAIRDQAPGVMHVDNIGILSSSDAVIRKVVPNVSYRMQCIHHPIVLRVDSVFYAIRKGGSAAIGEVIYVSLLTFSKELKTEYSFCLRRVQSFAFSWAGGPVHGIPQEYDERLQSTHATDLQRFFILLQPESRSQGFGRIKEKAFATRTNDSS